MTDIIRDRMIENNLSGIKKRIEDACKRVDRNPDEVELMAVTKDVGVSFIKEAISCGVTIFGENYVQESYEKFSEIGKINPDIHPQFIGHLQTNKVKKCLRISRMIQTVDNIKLAEIIQRYAQHPVRVLVQVSLSDDDNKYGHPYDRLDLFIEKLSGMDKLNICGLMGIAPYFDDPEKVRPCYRKLYKTFLNLRRKPYVQKSFSMISAGMSNDFEIAIEEGATMVRLGRAIFGERPSKEI